MKKEILFIVFFVITLNSVYSLEININEFQDIVIDNSRISIQSTGNLSITNISSEIFSFEIKENNIFDISLEVLRNNVTNYSYRIETTIPKSFYNEFRNSGVTFLEYTTNFDIQTHRDVSLTKFERDLNTTFSSRNVKIEAKNPTNYTQKILINLIKTRPNQVNDFRNQLYLLTLYELELNPFEKKELWYGDMLSEIGDSYFIDYSIEILPNIIRNIEVNETVVTKSSSGSSGGSSFTLLIEDIKISKSVVPELFRNGDILDVTLLISNPNSISLNNVIIEDLIPPSFILVTNPSTNIYSLIEDFLPFETKEIIYKLKYIGEDLEIITIPNTEVTYKKSSYISNNIRLYPQEEETPQLLIEKVLSPLENSNTLIQIFLTNIGNQTISSFNLKDQNNSFFIPTLEPTEEFSIEYESNTIDYSLPEIKNDINITSSIIVNDRISINHKTKSNTSRLSMMLIFLAGVLLISDIIL